MSKVFIVLALLISVQSLAAVNCGNGVNFAEAVTIVDDDGDRIRLDLNGVGLKRVLFFKVFYAALYLEDLSQNEEVIIQSDQHKVGIIHATRNINEKQLVDVWNDEFDRLCGTEKNCDKLRPFHEQFISYSRDVKKGERMYMISFPDRFEFETSKGETFPGIESPEYSRLLQNSLMGPDPADAELKKGLLGKKQVCQ